MTLERSATLLRLSDVASPRQCREGFLVQRGFDSASLHRLRVDLGACGHDLGLPGGDRYGFVLVGYEAAVNTVRHGGGNGHMMDPSGRRGRMRSHAPVIAPVWEGCATPPAGGPA